MTSAKKPLERQPVYVAIRPFFGTTTRPIELDVNTTKPQTAVYIQHYPWLRVRHLPGSPYSRK